MKRFYKTLVNLAITFVVGFIAFYLTLPAINMHSKDFYGFTYVNIDSLGHMPTLYCSPKSCFRSLMAC